MEILISYLSWYHDLSFVCPCGMDAVSFLFQDASGFLICILLLGVSGSEGFPLPCNHHIVPIRVRHGADCFHVAV